MGLKLSSEISAGHIMTALTLIGSVFFAWSDLDKRLTVSEAMIAVERSTEEDAKKWRIRIENKMDRFIERAK